ncbi:DUF6394 family protein [Granulosicoccus antarcticus]|uniref:Uncharacterized protein n=1 Tax=Granulosicoccus antarcticus IMCC3135 TaxID=1192854 RepID=A0A2Z2NMX2_9GAMM|nr:DUF6394 family protein [Granulosicoccus antarcticus]ASJ71078.1 hypothetical protein IMCC3135_04825 [Granulosicoccus antarcticus IMCC3135]
MNLERVVFGFFTILALTFNLIFVMGEIDNPSHHDVWVLTIAILVNLIATGLKLGDRSQIGALLLAASLVADLLLITARIFWIVAESDSATGPTAQATVNIVSLAAGALAANVVSAVILVGDALMSRR